MDKAYERILNLWKTDHSKSYCVILKGVLGKLPSPNQITENWILNLLAMWDNKHTKALYYRMLEVILQQIGKGNLISGIRASNPKPSVNHVDLITDTEYGSLLRACKSDRERAIIEILLNTGCRASELLSMDIRDIELVDDMLLLTLNGKTGRRTIPVVSDSVPSFPYYIATVSEGRVFPMFYQHLYEMIVDIFKRASVPKRKRAIHIFRHSRATALEQTMPEPLLRQYSVGLPIPECQG